MSLEEFLKQVKDIRLYRRAQAVKPDLECYPGKLTAQVLPVSVNFVGKWTPVLALAGGRRVQYTRHGAEGLRLTHKGSKGFLSGEDKQQVLEWISGQSHDKRTTAVYQKARHRLVKLFFKANRPKALIHGFPKFANTLFENRKPGPGFP